GLDAAAVAAALGIAGSQASGSMEFLTDGAWTKRFHPGWAACAGLHAAALARAGFRAPTTIVEGRFGFLHGYSDAANAAALDGTGAYELLQTGVKPHACCRYAQGPIDAVLALRAAHAIDPSHVTRIEVGIVEPGFPIVCEPLEAKRRPRSVVDGQFSLPFSVAVALVHGTVAPEVFVGRNFDDPLVRRVMDRVEPVRDTALDALFPRAWPCWVRVTLDDGTRHEKRVTHPLGDPENFPSPAAQRAKFAALAGRALPVDRIETVLAAVAGILSAGDVRTLLTLTQADI
ncbi:MAG: MmgE/PrpD family protein, partial [Candidatus Binatia bacterium]